VHEHVHPRRAGRSTRAPPSPFANAGHVHVLDGGQGPLPRLEDLCQPVDAAGRGPWRCPPSAPAVRRARRRRCRSAAGRGCSCRRGEARGCPPSCRDYTGGRGAARGCRIPLGDAARPAPSRVPGGPRAGGRRRLRPPPRGDGPIILFLVDNSASLPPSTRREAGGALEKMFTFLRGHRYRLILFGAKDEIAVDDVTRVPQRRAVD